MPLAVSWRRRPAALPGNWYILGSIIQIRAILIRLCEIPVPDFQEMAEDGRFRLLIGLAAWYQAKRHGLLNAQGGEL